MSWIQVQRPRGISGIVNWLACAALLTLLALKLTGVIGWSWWWVLSPLWTSAALVALAAGGLLVLWWRDRETA